MLCHLTAPLSVDIQYSNHRREWSVEWSVEVNAGGSVEVEVEVEGEVEDF